MLPGWWLKLQGWQAVNALRARPLRTLAMTSLWLVPGVLLPAICAFGGAALAGRALSVVLSIDIPLTLALASLVALDGLRARADATSCHWLHGALGPARVERMRTLAALLRAGRGPAVLSSAALLLGLGSRNFTGMRELLLMAALACVAGGTLWWLLATRREPVARPVSATASTGGLASLSRIPLREAGRQFDMRRATLIAVPVMLAAPMGSTAGGVGMALAGWLPLTFVALCCREAATVHRVMHAWQGHRVPAWRLMMLVWRYVALLLALVLLAVGLSAPVTRPLSHGVPR